MNELKMIKMSIRKLLPDTMTYSEKCKLLEEMAEEYRKKARKDVYDSVRSKPKTDGYEPFLGK